MKKTILIFILVFCILFFLIEFGIKNEDEHSFIGTIIEIIKATKITLIENILYMFLTFI